MSAGSGLGKLAVDLLEAAEPYGPWVQLMVGFFAVGFVATFVVVRHRQRRDGSD